jgi:hypothetical protein
VDGLLLGAVDLDDLQRQVGSLLRLRAGLNQRVGHPPVDDLADLGAPLVLRRCPSFSTSTRERDQKRPVTLHQWK